MELPAGLNTSCELSGGGGVGEGGGAGGIGQDRRREREKQNEETRGALLKVSGGLIIDNS